MNRPISPHSQYHEASHETTQINRSVIEWVDQLVGSCDAKSWVVKCASDVIGQFKLFFLANLSLSCYLALWVVSSALKRRWLH